MSKIAIALLSDLESALRSEDLVDQNFDMDHWCDLLGNIMLSEINPNLCGFSACAGGLGCTLPSWQKHGFRLENNYTNHLVVKFSNYDNFEALKVGLGLDSYVEFIFSPDCYFNPEFTDNIFGEYLEEEQMKLLPDDDPYFMEDVDEISRVKIEPYMVANRIKNVIEELKNGT